MKSSFFSKRHLTLFGFLSLLGLVAMLLIERSQLKKQVASKVDPQPELTQTKTPLQDVETKPSRRVVPHLVKELLDPALHFNEQIEAVRALPSDLTHAEFDALISLLREDIPRMVNPHVWSTLQNEIMEVLREPRFERTDYHTALIAIMEDREADPVMRDYAAQHLALYVSDLGSTLPPTTVEETISSLISILDGKRELKQQVTGTTLMALCQMSEKSPEHLEKARPAISEAVLNLLDLDQDVSLSNRISAIQSAGRLHITEALPAVREMAHRDDIEPNYRLSSIAALGYYLDPDDEDFLQELALSTSRFRHAAEAALNNFKS